MVAYGGGTNTKKEPIQQILLKHTRYLHNK